MLTFNNKEHFLAQALPAGSSGDKREAARMSSGLLNIRLYAKAVLHDQKSIVF